MVCTGFQYGGTVAIIVERFEIPKMSTPHANFSGVNVTPASAAYPAVARAVDGDPLWIRDLLRDRPVDRVDEVVMHLGAPLEIRGVDERLAEAARRRERIRNGALWQRIPGPESSRQRGSF
jgi:hypothetical protein